MGVRREHKRPAVAAMVTVGGIVMLAGMFGPWVRSGAASRSSFEMVDLIDRLGFAQQGPVGPAIRSWPLAPLLVVIATVMSWRLSWRLSGRVASAIAVFAGSTVGGVGLAVANVPESVMLGARWGALVTAAGGVLMMLGGIVGLLRSGAGSIWQDASDVPDAALVEDIP